MEGGEGNKEKEKEANTKTVIPSKVCTRLIVLQHWICRKVISTEVGKLLQKEGQSPLSLPCPHDMAHMMFFRMAWLNVLCLAVIVCLTYLSLPWYVISK